MAFTAYSHFIAHPWFKLKLRLGILQGQSPALPWQMVKPALTSSGEFAIKWKAKSPNLPIALAERRYLAPHLEQFAVDLGHSPEAEAKAIAGGRFRLNNGEFINLGSPPDWHRGRQAWQKLHWTKVYETAEADAVAEVSQFNWAYALVRAWILTGEDVHVETYWALLEDWLKNNPPNLGSNWTDEDTIARRLIAITYATQALRFHPSITDERILQVARMVTVSAERLYLTFNNAYVRSVTLAFRSALALFSAGALWPQLGGAGVWRSTGLEFLINEGKRVMTSQNDKRLCTSNAVSLLEIFTWTEVILRSENERESLPESLHAQIRIAAKAVTRPSSPTARFEPLFYLSGCSPSDTRSVVATALILFTGVRFSAGPWDEATLLLAGPICASSHSL